jgi:protocatechuate 3,4-dioxygenase beta subunit
MDHRPAKIGSPIADLSRRGLLMLFGSVAAETILGCGRKRSASEKSRPAPTLDSAALAAGVPACIVRPEQTEGPYFIDEKLNRSDIRVDPSDNSTKAGVPLRLEFHVSRVAAGSCAPLSGAMVDIWHCDALGAYSNVRDASFDTRGRKFLRGYQVTNEKGAAEFLTIYPGWYEGRAVHIHFKIRIDPPASRAREFTSQLYFDESITDQVYQQAPYNRKGRRTTTNDADFIFRSGGKQLIPTLSKDSQGYTAKFDIGIQMS